MSTSVILSTLSVITVSILIILTVCPQRYRPKTRTNVHFERGLAFAVAACCVVATFPGHRPFVAILCIVGAGLSELLQKFVHSRHPGLTDATAKAIGAAVGAIIAMAMLGS